jgi:hypothetical protein
VEFVSSVLPVGVTFGELLAAKTSRCAGAQTTAKVRAKRMVFKMKFIDADLQADDQHGAKPFPPKSKSKIVRGSC